MIYTPVLNWSTPESSCPPPQQQQDYPIYTFTHTSSTWMAVQSCDQTSKDPSAVSDSTKWKLNQAPSRDADDNIKISSMPKMAGSRQNQNIKYQNRPLTT